MRPAKRSGEARLGVGWLGRRATGAFDKLDLGLIDALRANGRESFRKLAGRLDVSEATIRARFNRLSRENLLRVTAVVDPQRLGFDTMALVAIKTSGPPTAIAEQLSRWPEASSVVIAAGQYDVLAEVICLDRHELLEVTTRIRELDGVATTELLVYLQLCKQAQDWGAPVA